MIGHNDGFVFEPEFTIDNIKLIIDHLHINAPNAKIVLFSLLPCFEGITNDHTKQNMKVNDSISKLDALDYVTYVNIFDSFLDSDGTLKEELYIYDKMHLSDSGYNVWASIIENLK